ncbi:MAG: arginine deiminase [Sphaerochaeta sp.]
MNSPISVTSEVGNLKSVLLHRPGRELESLTPQYLDSMLFEDIPFLAQMQSEHDMFASLLREQGCSVHYIETLLGEVFQDVEQRKLAVDYLVNSSQIFSPSLKQIVQEHLHEADAKALVAYCIGGLLKTDIDDKVEHKTLSYYIRDTFPYYIPPLPNLYFTRDPATVVGGGISINLMKSESRRRENWILSLIAKHNPLFARARVHQDYTANSNIEGGDILMLNEKSVICGSSARTDVWAIEGFANRMLAPIEEGGEGLETVLVMQIPYTRAYMHLDTVFTMVDRDAFCMFPGIGASVNVFSMRRNSKDHLDIHAEPSLKKALRQTLGVPSVNIIKSGGNDVIASAREQWNDSTNTLAIAPGKVITYCRNVVSNEVLQKNGIEVLPIKGSELVRGRGGPRCMSMPLWRESV